MTTWPDPERLLIARYLAGLGLRSTNSRTYYKQVLHSFQDVAERHAELGQDVLVAWLQISSDSWAASTRLHRTRIIDRFLDDRQVAPHGLTVLFGQQCHEAYNLNRSSNAFRASFERGAVVSRSTVVRAE